MRKDSLRSLPGSARYLCDSTPTGKGKTPGEKHDLRSELKRRVILDGARKVWTAELAIPMKCLVARFDPAVAWRVNFYRVEGAKEPRFYSAWRPTETPAPNFHVPEAFGELVFANS